MSAIDDLFIEVPPSVSCLYLTLTDACPGESAHGRYIKLYCLDADDLPIEAMADHRHFHLLEPYIDLLRQHRQAPLQSDQPVIPVFKGDDGRWRFSWRAATRDYPELASAEPAASPAYTPDSAMASRAFRLQVSVPGSLAEAFKAHAAQRGMRHTDLLLTMIQHAVT